jgi:signal transduction histidine kinase
MTMCRRNCSTRCGLNSSSSKHEDRDDSAGAGHGAKASILATAHPVHLAPRAVPRPRRGEFVPIFVSGEPVGRVVVLPGGPPFSRIVRQFGPTIALVATSVLVVGTTLIALVVFGPARRRLKAVQGATDRLGAGDLDARAPEQGGDEVTAVARSFNRMAEELSIRTRALEAVDTTRRQLLADVSHELMTPLTAMRGYLETIVDVGARDPIPRPRSGIYRSSPKRRSVSSASSAICSISPGSKAAAPRCDKSASISRRYSIASPRVTSVRCGNGTCGWSFHVGAGAETVIGDPDRLEQALQNLAANALRHTPDGGQITLTSTADPGAVRLMVARYRAWYSAGASTADLRTLL